MAPLRPDAAGLVATARGRAPVSVEHSSSRRQLGSHEGTGVVSSSTSFIADCGRSPLAPRTGSLSCARRARGRPRARRDEAVAVKPWRMSLAVDAGSRPRERRTNASRLVRGEGRRRHGRLAKVPRTGSTCDGLVAGSTSTRAATRPWRRRPSIELRSHALHGDGRLPACVRAGAAVLSAGPRMRRPIAGLERPSARYATSRSFCASASDCSFLSDWFSIWRMRSRVTLNVRPTSSSVRGCSPPRP